MAGVVSAEQLMAEAKKKKEEAEELEPPWAKEVEIERQQNEKQRREEKRAYKQKVRADKVAAAVERTKRGLPKNAEEEAALKSELAAEAAASAAATLVKLRKAAKIDELKAAKETRNAVRKAEADKLLHAQVYADEVNKMNIGGDLTVAAEHQRQQKKLDKAAMEKEKLKQKLKDKTRIEREEKATHREAQSQQKKFAVDALEENAQAYIEDREERVQEAKAERARRDIAERKKRQVDEAALRYANPALRAKDEKIAKRKALDAKLASGGGGITQSIEVEEPEEVEKINTFEEAIRARRARKLALGWADKTKLRIKQRAQLALIVPQERVCRKELDNLKVMRKQTRQQQIEAAEKRMTTMQSHMEARMEQEQLVAKRKAQFKGAKVTKAQKQEKINTAVEQYDQAKTLLKKAEDRVAILLKQCKLSDEATLDAGRILADVNGRSNAEVKDDTKMENIIKKANKECLSALQDARAARKNLKLTQAQNSTNPDTHNIDVARAAKDQCEHRLDLANKKVEELGSKKQDTLKNRQQTRFDTHERCKAKASTLRKESSAARQKVVEVEKICSEANAEMEKSNRDLQDGVSETDQQRIFVREEQGQMNIVLQQAEEEKEDAENLLLHYERKQAEISKDYEDTHMRYSKLKKAKTFLEEALGIESKDVFPEPQTEKQAKVKKRIFETAENSKPTIAKRSSPPVKPSHRSRSCMPVARHLPSCNCGTCSFRPYQDYTWKPPPKPLPEPAPTAKPVFEVTRLYDASPYTRDLILRQQGRLKAEALRKYHVQNGLQPL